MDLEQYEARQLELAENFHRRLDDDDTDSLYDATRALKELLPHGSGIDGDWSFDFKKGECYCFNSYHAMNDAGFYVGWAPFVFRFKLDDPASFKIQFFGKRAHALNQRHLLKDALEDDLALIAKRLELAHRRVFPGTIAIRKQGHESYFIDAHKERILVHMSPDGRKFQVFRVVPGGKPYELLFETGGEK